MDKVQPKLSRRTVFAGAGTAGALAAVAAVLPKSPATAPATAAALSPQTAKGGYQETQHVLRYYQTTRI